MNVPPSSHSPFGCVVEVDVDPGPRADPTGEAFAANLTTTLLALVPLWIATVRTLTGTQRQDAAAAAAQTIARHGDDLQYGGTNRGPALNATAEALAILAYTEGGVTALGIHACVQPHHGCPATSADPAPSFEPPTTTTTLDTETNTMTTPDIIVTASAGELYHHIRDHMDREADLNPPADFRGSADWQWSWPLRLADAIDAIDYDEFIRHRPTGRPVGVTIRGTDDIQPTIPFSVEARDDDDVLLARRTYTEPLPPRPGRTDPGTLSCAAADAVHILLTVLEHLNSTHAYPPE